MHKSHQEESPRQKPYNEEYLHGWYYANLIYKNIDEKRTVRIIVYLKNQE